MAALRLDSGDVGLRDAALVELLVGVGVEAVLVARALGAHAVSPITSDDPAPYPFTFLPQLALALEVALALRMTQRSLDAPQLELEEA